MIKDIIHNILTSSVCTRNLTRKLSQSTSFVHNYGYISRKTRRKSKDFCESKK